MDNVIETTNFGGEVVISTREIDDVAYVVWFEERNDKYSVLVYANRDGSKSGLDKHETNLSNKYDYRFGPYTAHKVGQFSSDRFLSWAINEAICEYEAKRASAEKYKLAVYRALEANKEVHESGSVSQED